MEKTILSQKIQHNRYTNKCFLETLFEDKKGWRGLSSEPMTPEEAAEWEAEHNY